MPWELLYSPLCKIGDIYQYTIGTTNNLSCAKQNASLSGVSHILHTTAAAEWQQYLQPPPVGVVVVVVVIATVAVDMGTVDVADKCC